MHAFSKSLMYSYLHHLESVLDGEVDKVGVCVCVNKSVKHENACILIG
jgi:hypothetical protein